MTLEIKVNESITVFDTVGELIKEVNRIIETWVLSDDKEPLVIVLKKREDRGPPTLAINVTDTFNISEALG